MLLALAYVLAAAFQLPLSAVALGGSGLLALGAVRHHCFDWHRLKREISWSLFVFISGMFLLVRSVENLGLTAAFGRSLLHFAGNSPLRATILTAAGTALGSNLINNVPMTLIMTSAMSAIQTTGRGHEGLIYAIMLGADLGPNLTTVGSLATMLWLLALRRKDAEDARTEFWMGVVGPITSALIGAGCLALAYALGWVPEKGMMRTSTPIVALLLWLGYINIALAVFNMILGFPLDGGRVLRAIVWWVTGNATRATRIAAQVGRLVAFFFIIWGIFRFFGGAGFGGLWIAFIGWFLLDAARASYAQVVTTESLQGVRVADVMARDCPRVDGRSNLQTFVDEHLLHTGRRCFVVEENGELVGLITVHEVKEVERQKWPYTTVDDVMRPLDKSTLSVPRFRSPKHWRG